jgi:cysteinyl-tRNA synthetase
VNLGGSKMSKSVGNFFFIEDIAARVDPEVTRFYLLSTHYRSPIEFSFERLNEAGVAYARLRLPLERANVWAPASSTRPGGALGEACAEAERKFHEEMLDDFNTAAALGHLFDLARAVNRGLDEGAGAEAVAAARELYRLGAILGLFWKAPTVEEWSPEVLALAAARLAARQGKDWKRSDELRDQLDGLGILVKDTAEGQRLSRK